MNLEDLLPISAIALVLGLTGSCVHDRVTAEARVTEVSVVDKDYSPPHTSMDCDSKGHCTSTYHGPSWSIRYEDGVERYSTTVSAGVYEALRLGDRKILTYKQGGGLWGARYAENFQLVAQVAEGSWPTR